MLPENWQNLRLLDICRPRQWPTISKDKFTPDGFPVYGANGQIGYYSEYTHADETIAITCRGATCGTINVVPAKSYITGNAMALDAVNSKIVSQDYLYHSLNHWGVADSITGSAQPQITRESLSKVKFPFPPLPEQRRIAEILGSVDAAIEATKAVIEQTKTVKQGLLQTLLTRGIGHTEFKDSPLGEIPKNWEVRPLSACLKNLDSRRKPVKKDDRAKMRGSIPYYGASGIIDWVNDFLFDEPLLLLAEDGANLLSKSTPIAFVATGKTWVNNHAHVYQPTGVLEVCLAEEWLCHADIAPFITGSAQPKLNKDKADSIPMPVPPVAEQREINEVIHSVNMEMKAEEAKLSSLQAVKKGLVADLLTGKVRVPEPMELAA